MGDQLITRAKFDSLIAAIKTLSEQMETLTAQADNNNNNPNPNPNNNNKNNLNRGGGQISVIRVHNNNHTIDDSSSEEEEVVTEEGNECGNHHDYRVKAYISLFYRTTGVEEFLDWKIDVDRFFDVMDVPENK